MLLLVAVAPSEIEPVAATELDDLLDGATELTTELDERLDGAAEELGTDDGATDEVVPPHADAVNCALFLPTPA